MGNAFLRLFRKDEDEISDIRHYLAYLNQEKVRNFEPLQDAKKGQAPAQPAFCDMSRCANYLAFKPKSVLSPFCGRNNQLQISWKQNLREECKFLARSFEWGKVLDKEVAKFEGNNDQVYQMEVTWIMNNATSRI